MNDYTIRIDISSKDFELAVGRPPKSQQELNDWAACVESRIEQDLEDTMQEIPSNPDEYTEETDEDPENEHGCTCHDCGKAQCEGDCQKHYPDGE